MAIKCPKCDFEKTQNALFCGNCGTQFSSSEEVLTSHTKTFQASAKDLLKGTIFAGRYNLIEEVGKGGMGIVYKAEDTKLKRTVALKSLSPKFLGGTEEKSRFLREARAAASLNHPNICTVYEIDENEEMSFIAMEFVDGQTLKEKAALKPIKIADVLDIAIQTSDGLKQAHEKGVIHRDIKSTNIMVTDKGQAKIMDFGLAKLAEGSQVTREGTTLGTISYMSPEQTQGESVDHRSDVWSLGVVLFELVAGQLPFHGEYDQAIVYSILNKDPQPLTSLRSGVPLDLERIVNKCLEKDPNYRYQSVSDIMTDLKRLKRDIVEEKTILLSPKASEKRRKIDHYNPFLVSSAVVILLAALAVMYNFFLKPTQPAVTALSELILTPLTSGEGLSVLPCWSPDGTWIAYASNEAGSLDIWKKPTEGGEAIQLTSSLHNESYPAWSPDGRKIAFSSDKEKGGIFLIPAEGGTPWQVTSFGAHPTWSPNNETIAFDWCGNIYLVPYSGGEPKMVFSGSSAIPYINWTSDGEKLIFWNRTQGDIFVMNISDRKLWSLKIVPPGTEVSGITLSKDGSELIISLGPYGGDKNLYKVKIHNEREMPIGKPSLISLTPTEDIQCMLSPDGSMLAFSVCQLSRHLWAFPLDSATGLASGEPERITFKSQQNYYPAFSPDGRILVWTSHITNQGTLTALNIDEQIENKVTSEWGSNAREIGGSFSPDGKQVSYSSTIGGSYEIWRLPSLGSVPLRLTRAQHPDRDTLTAWSPDGKTVAFYSNRSGSWDIWSVQADGNEQPKQLTSWESNENYPSWSPDGQNIAFRTDKNGNGDIWIMGAAGDNQKPYVVHPDDDGWSAWSPNGRWFYFISNRSGAYNVWMKPTTGGEERLITTYKGLPSGLPNNDLYTKFAVSSSSLIVPVETRKGNVFIFKNMK